MSFARGIAVPFFPFGVISQTDGNALETGSITGYITKDGVQAKLKDTPHYVGNKQWTVNLAADEMDGEIIGLVFVATNAIPVLFTIKTFSSVLINLIVGATAAVVNNLTISPSNKTDIINAITGAIAHYLQTINIQPERIILGPCERSQAGTIGVIR